MQLNFLGQRAAHDADHERRGSQRLDAFLFAGVSVVALANKGIRRWESVANTTNLKGIRQNESELSTLLYKAALLTFCDLVLGKGPELRDLPNVMLLPHMGSATVEGRVEMGEKVLINIKTFADGHRPPDQVLPSML